MDSFIIKIGGVACESDRMITTLAKEIKELSLSTPINFLIVHGGGKAVSSIQEQYGIAPVFIDGKRQTSVQEMDLVDMGLAGLMNKKVVRSCQRGGLKALGLSGSDGEIFLSEDALESGNGENRTGCIIKCNPSLITLLIGEGYTPIINSVCHDSQYKGMNINADEAALALAKSLKAKGLLFISDIPGVLIDQRVEPYLDRKSSEFFISKGEIKGGMIPKIRSSLAALKEGVKEISISNYTEPGDLKKLLNGSKGTKISLEESPNGSKYC